MKMAITICIINRKGGVGKTTTSVNVAGILATRGYATLLVDSDPQGNATSYYGLYDEALPSIYDVLKASEPVPAINAIRHPAVPHLDVLPSSSEFLKANGEMSLINIGKEFILSDALKPMQGLYDYITIDCPPADDNVTTNDLVASDYILLPTIADDFAFKSIMDMIALLKKVQRSNPRLKNLGTLITLDERTTAKTAYKEMVRGIDGFPSLKTCIRKNTKLQEAINGHLPIHLYEPKSAGAQDYNALVDELLTLCK